MSATLVKDSQYTINGYTFYCAKVDDNYAVLHTPVLTECAWPGYTMSKYGNGNYYNGDIDGVDISDYNSNTTAIYNSIKDCEYTSATFGSGLYLADQDFTNTRHASYFFTLVGEKIWTGKRRGDYTVNVYDIQSEYGGAINPKDQADTDGSLILFFNIDTSKINLNGSTITIQGSYQQKVLNETDTSYLLNKIAQLLNSQIYSQSTPVATTSVLGKVKPDGTTIQINNNGVISLKSNLVTIATNSTNGLVKPDDDTIGVKNDGTLYIKTTFDPIDIEDEEESSSGDESTLPYLVALLTDGTDVVAIGYNKSKIDSFADNKGIGSDGFVNGANTKHYINLFEYNGSGFREYNMGDTYYTSSQWKKPDFFESSACGNIIIYKNNNLAKALNYFYWDNSQEIDGYINNYNYNIINITGSDNTPGYLVKANGSQALNILCSNNQISNGFYKPYTYITNRNDTKLVYVDSGRNVDVIGTYPTISQAIANGCNCAFIDNSNVHIIDGSGIHTIHKPSTSSTITDIFLDKNNNNLNITNTIICGVQYFNDTFYAVCMLNNSNSICSYNLSTNTWKEIVPLPDSTSIATPNEWDYVILSNGDIHFLIKNYYQKKITYWIYDHTTTEWTKVDTCIPELWYIQE